MDAPAPVAPELAELAQALAEFQAAIPRQKEANPPDLLAIFERLDRLEAALPAQTPPQLRHYLHQKSYRKAYLFLHGAAP